MSNESYVVYLNETIRLARSLIIKLDFEVKQNNDFLRQVGLPVEEDPKQWRYYRNLNGEYHPSNTLMTTVSLDTQETIELNKSVLFNHPNTAEAMLPGGSVYKDLVRRYPAQLVLIRGLVNPIEFDVAYTAEQGTILWYDKHLVGKQESNLIHELEKEIKSVLGRWLIDTHFTSNGLAGAAILIALAKHTVDHLQVIRQLNNHSYRASRYHIWHYLASRGGLDRYLPYLSNKQIMWLYREANYLMQNAGKQETLDTLIDNLLTPIGVRAYALTLSVRSDNYPKLSYRVDRTPLNFKETQAIDLLPLTIDEVNQRLNLPLQLSGEERLRDTDWLGQRLPETPTTHYATKVIETYVPSNIDLTNDTDIAFLLRQWGYYSLTNRYSAIVRIREPRSGELLSLDVKKAYHLYLRMFDVAMRTGTSNLTQFGITRVLTVHQPDREQIDKQYPKVKRTHIDALFKDTAYHRPVTSTEAFFDFAMQQRKAVVDFDLHGQQQQNSLIEASYYSIIHNFKRDVSLPIDKEVMGTAWLTSVSPGLLLYRPDEAMDLMVELMVSCCQLERLPGFNKGVIRDQLVKLIEELNTYHNTFISNGGDETPLNARIEVSKIIDYVTNNVSKTYRIPTVIEYHPRQTMERKRVIMNEPNRKDTVVKRSQGRVSIKHTFVNRATKQQSNTVLAYFDAPVYRLIEG